MFGKSTFKIKGLNIEKNLNILSKKFAIYDTERIEKNLTQFSVDFRYYKNVKKELIKLGYEIVEEKNSGFLPFIFKNLCNFGAIFAILLAFILYTIQSPIILQYEILGTESLNKEEIVLFIEDNFSQNKNKLDTLEVENALYKNFEKISFVSVMVKGQTLVINIKERLMPDEMYGEFQPIYSQFDGKITEINIISGTAEVSIGDFVFEGDILVQPFYLDSSGNMQKVEADAEIKMEVYHTAQITHFDTRVEVVRTGEFKVIDEIQLFGLTIYKNGEDVNYSRSETSVEYEDLVKNNLLPFKLKRTTIYELEEVVINEEFEEVSEKIITEAREKALENCENYDTIVDEFYTLKHISSATIVDYVIVEEIIQEN